MAIILCRSIKRLRRPINPLPCAAPSETSTLPPELRCPCPVLTFRPSTSTSTARAKGLREKVVVYSHAWRNALLPVITVLIGWFISIFSGSLIIEQMFALNGMGQLYYQGLMNNDFELALAIQMFYVLIALVGQLITDLSYGIVDPRVRVNK